MKKIISNAYYTAFNDPDRSINLIRWTQKILNLTTEEYKKGIIRAFTSLNNFSADYLIIDNTDAIYPITETLEEWIIENVVPLNRHYKKVAYVYPKDFLTRMGIEEIVKKTDKISPESRKRRDIFDNIEDAIKWLLS